jgi:hypothetical protein
MKTDNIPFQRVQPFKHLVTTLTNQYSIQEEIKSRFTSGNVSCHSVQNPMSSTLLSKNIQIKNCRSIILPVFCMYGKLVHSSWGSNAGWGCSRIGCWGEYLGMWHLKYTHFQYLSPNDARIQNPETITESSCSTCYSLRTFPYLFNFSFNICYCNLFTVQNNKWQKIRIQISERTAQNVSYVSKGKTE